MQIKHYENNYFIKSIYQIIIAQIDGNNIIPF